MNDIAHSLIAILRHLLKEHPPLAPIFTMLAEQASQSERREAPIAHTLLDSFNYLMQRHPELAENMENAAARVHGRRTDDLDLLLTLPPEQAPGLIPLLKRTPSQMRQDLFVLSELNFKRGGYFLEFGASGGFSGSNTWLLERDFAWSGILAEPARKFHDELRACRSAIIDTRCVWRESGKILIFNEVSHEGLGGLSTLDMYSAADDHAELRKQGHHYDVETISLMDLLAVHNAPSEIDYLSIDTEGSELDILTEFDFDKYKIDIITCEHNYTPAREKISDLLTHRGYVQKYPDISKYDDWFVRAR